MSRNKSKTRKSEGARSQARAWEAHPWLAQLVTLLVLSLATLFALPLGATTTEPDGDAYGFVSRVDGDVLLAGLEGDDAVEAEVNHPLLTGDEITTNTGRIELVLPDGSVIRAGRVTSVTFEALAGSPDSEVGGGSQLSLDEGTLQIRTPETFYGGEDLAIRTPNATVYLGPDGNYRVASKGSTFTEVVVRTGFAEADTRNGSAVARDGDALEISGYGRPFVNLVDAGPANSLELWAGDLDRAAYESVEDEVDPRLAYAAAPLRDAGEWVVADSRRAWRPYVRADWRPFRYGRWVYTPSGLTWVASAPWGWVTSHYGFWDYVPGYGWLWLPGNVYTPAGVYWYWGPTHVAWIPYGYYNRHHHSGFRFGVYGWAGGDWGYWADWTFCPTRYFGRRGYDRYWDSGRNLARERRFAVPRGIVTTDTRGLGPDRWGKPTELMGTLVKRVDPQGRVHSLPDVTESVARRELALSNEGQARERETAARRLQPLSEERRRGRFRTRSLTVDTRTGVSSRSQDRRSDGESSERRGNATIRRVTRQPEAGLRESGEVEQPRGRVRGLAGTRLESETRVIERERPSGREGVSSLSRSVPDRTSGTERAPARRVLERIRAHRQTTRDSVSRTSGKSTSSRATPPKRSSRQSQDRSTSASRKSGTSPSKSTQRSSGSSTRGSSSNRSGARKASPPSRSSRGNSSGASRSRSRSRRDH